MLFPGQIEQTSEVVQKVDHVRELPLAAVELFHLGPLIVTNSALVSYAVAALVIFFAQKAMRNAALQPGRLQNFCEWIVESLQRMLQSILGPALTRKTFWFFATVFIFILATNWLSLFPGAGTIGFGEGAHWFNLHVTKPFLRGANADVNMTLAISLVFFGLWLVWAFQSNGLGGMIHHLFGAKGGQGGAMGLFLAVIFIFVGCIELVSIFVRPISLTFRLYGNVYGGEYMLETLMNLVPALSWLIPLPFYFFELMVGFVQALVFCLLTAVFTAMMCRHEEPKGKNAAGPWENFDLSDRLASAAGQKTKP